MCVWGGHGCRGRAVVSGTSQMVPTCSLLVINHFNSSLRPEMTPRSWKNLGENRNSEKKSKIFMCWGRENHGVKKFLVDP